MRDLAVSGPDLKTSELSVSRRLGKPLPRGRAVAHPSPQPRKKQFTIIKAASIGSIGRDFH